MIDLLDGRIGMREFLFTGPGGDMLDAVYEEAIRLCTLAGAVRADKAVAVATASTPMKAAALDYLVEIDALREITPSGTAAGHRVFVLVE